MYEKNEVNYIIYLVKRMKEESTEDYQIWNTSAKYILNQLLRQLRLPEDKWLVTYMADTLWKQITSENMSDYGWQKKVTLTRNDNVEVSKYTGNSKKPNTIQLSRGDSFAFREVFHDEHVIPIKVIIDELVELNPLTYENVLEVISKITICRMLKKEDRAIYSSHKRSSNLSEIIEETYLKAGVYVKDYKYKHFIPNTEEDLKLLENSSLCIPKEMIVEFFPHPEPYGYKIAIFPNGMTTDVYEAEDGDFYSQTNNLDLINYILFMQEVVAMSKKD